MTPSRSASTSAIESTTGPRDVFTRIAVGFIQPRRSALMRPFVSGLRFDVERHEVRLGQDALEGPVLGAVFRLDRRAHPVRVVIQDPHPEAARPPRDRLADPPEPDDPERGAVDVRPHQQHRAPGLPLAGADVVVALREAARGGHEQRPREVRGGLGQDAGRVADRDAALRARRDVDVVEPDREVADDLELRPGPVEELVVDAVGEQRQDAVAALDRAEEGVARRRQLVLPDLGVARLGDAAGGRRRG